MRKNMVCAIALAAMTAPAFAQGEVNLYSSRHYDTDEALYSNFSEQTGIEVNRIEDSADTLIARMQSEGELSPADVLITVDVSRLERAAEAGLLQPLNSEVVVDKVPAALHDDDDLWAGVSTRVRAIFYDKDDVENPPQSYEELADPQYEGMVCTRSSSNVYMRSLLAAIIAHHGEEAAKEWAAGVKSNLARDPQGGDTDQLRAIISGECDIVLSNHYYYARGLAKEVTGLSDGIDQIGIVWPNQDSYGAHQNISGVGIAANAPNPQNARLFVEYLLTEQAQKMLADGNNEFPVVAGVAPSEPVQAMGTDFNRDDIDLAEVADNANLAQRVYNEVGYQ
jgi:iron(III) transport system substrate-binding protein